MSYDDKKKGWILPTRTGRAIGTAAERGMLDALGGSDGYRKRIQKNLDGSTTRLETKNGQPRFITTPAPAAATELAPYLESGQLEWTYPGDANPTRLDPASWHFLDIATSGDYLGFIAPTLNGDQKTGQVLAESQASRAIGYPPTTDPAIKATREEDYGPNTLIKKIAAGLFPASLFSGKMRLFVQAQYGAAEKQSIAPPLRAELVGSIPILKYHGRDGDTSVQFGLWAHSSPGIFTAADGTFWLITITRPSATYFATAYRINQDATGRALVAEHKARIAAGTLGAEERAQLEAYIFAHSTIDTANPSLIGSFTGAAGGAMAYGWKWNSDGSKASIVVHETLGTGAANNRWNASTIHVTFTYSEGALGLSTTVEAGGEWTDGWGAFNIFVPNDDTSTAPLVHYSLATNAAGVMPAFSFADVPVYGYYKDDVWEPVTMTRVVLSGSFPQHEWTSSSNILYDPSTDPDLFINARYQSGAVAADESCSYEQTVINSGTTMDVTVGGTTYAGVSYNGVYSTFTKEVELTTTTDNAVNFSGVVGAPAYTPGTPPGYSPVSGGANGGGFVLVAEVTVTERSMTGTRNEAWTLVIPAGDCEAAYVATHIYDSAPTYTHRVLLGYGVGRFTGAGYSFAPWSAPHHTNGWFGSYGPADVVTTDSDPPPTAETFVYCYNAVLSGAAGTPGGSYTTLFSVDYTYPYYDRGMYTYTSAGLRYVMSEGLLSPASVNYQHRFVGWA